jgi:nitroreductase
MHVMDAVKKRRSIRKYKDIPVEWDKVVNILFAGQYAPSAGNLQDWKFITVTDPGLKEKITEACLNQVWMLQAPVFIVVCSLPERTHQYYGDRGKKYVYENCACAGMNMMLEATEQGLGSCWVGAFDETLMRTALGIPDRARPEMVLTLGYADEEVPVPPRTVLESMVFLQKYGNRIKNVNMVLWDWSLMMEDYAKQGKSSVKKNIDKLKHMIKDKIEEKAKKAEEKEEEKRLEEERKKQSVTFREPKS